MDKVQDKESVSVCHKPSHSPVVSNRTGDSTIKYLRQDSKKVLSLERQTYNIGRVA